MNTVRRICRLVRRAAAITGCLIATAAAQEVVGTWNCNLSAEDADSGMSMKAEFEQTYDADGTYERAGQMSLAIAALQVDFSVSIKEAGTWRLADSMVIGETTTELAFTSTKEMPSQIEQMLLQQMQAAADAESAREQTVKLTAVTATTMEYEDAEGIVSQCRKA